MLKIKQRYIIIIAMLFLVFVMAFNNIEPEHNVPETTISDVIYDKPGESLQKLLDDMTVEEKVGQMFMACIYEGVPNTEYIDAYHPGSILLFGNSFKEQTPDSMNAALSTLQQASHIPMLTAVDEEGGTVNRMSFNPGFRDVPFPSPRVLYASGGLEAVLSDAQEKNQLIKSSGLNLNLAPVCDISQDPEAFMYSRSLGEDAKTTSTYIRQLVKLYNDEKVGCTLKHFPGYGNLADTHTGAVTDNRTLDELKKKDLLPFQAGINAGAGSIMVCHNTVAAMDSINPASLSPAVHNYLRMEMDFEGVIITDDLSMGAITSSDDAATVAVYAVLAGNDMLCTGQVKDQYAALLNAVKSGQIPESRIDASVLRILKWKISLGLIDLQKISDQEKGIKNKIVNKESVDDSNKPSATDASAGNFDNSNKDKDKDKDEDEE